LIDNLQKIEDYLKTHENKDMLRFLTCGSVDDGKSTLIGRLLYDTKMVFEDQLSAIEAESKKYGTTGDKLDLALLVDGLQSEREQGITIDVAYRFFTTEKRKYIIADTPGHEQYTRNMVTGASTADVAIILIDARKGILTQTRRHSFIVNLLGIENVIVAINKMDLVRYNQEVFESIKKDYEKLAKELGIKNIDYIPLSALDGDNVVDKSKNTPWYKQKPLLELLDTINITKEIKEDDFRFPVQYVNRPNLNFRGFCGTISSGSIKVGDDITVLPSKKTTKVKSIINAGDITERCRDLTTKQASKGMAVTLSTTDEIDISRGDIIVHNDDKVEITNSLEAMIVWMDEKSMNIDKTYDIKISTSIIPIQFEEINYKIDVNSYKKTKVKTLELNDIASVNLLLTQQILVDNYIKNKEMGSFIVIDRVTNSTVGAGMIVKANKTKIDNDENIFDIWNEKKKEINTESEILKFREKDIVFLSMGQNIGYEQYGKGEHFLRPVLVYKKFNKRTFLGIPLSSKNKDGSYYFSFNYKNDILSTANFSQIKTFDIKRAKYKSGTIKDKDFISLSEKLIKLLKVTL